MADQPWDPHPRRHLLTHHPRKEDQTTDQTTTPTEQPAPRAPRRAAMADTHVTITGNLTDDPDLRYTPNGTQVATFRLGPV